MLYIMGLGMVYLMRKCRILGPVARLRSGDIALSVLRTLSNTLLQLLYEILLRGYVMMRYCDSSGVSSVVCCATFLTFPFLTSATFLQLSFTRTSFSFQDDIRTNRDPIISFPCSLQSD